MIFQKKYFVLFLIFFLILLPNIKAQINVTANQTWMNVTIALAPNIQLTTSTDKSSYCPPETVYITTTLKNVGNLDTTGDLVDEVLDPYGELFMREEWNDILLNPLDEKEFHLNHTVTEDDTAGIYTIKSNFTYNGKEKYTETSFRIKQGIGELVASPSSIEKTAAPGDVVTETLYFWLVYPCYGTYVYLNTSEGPPGDWVIFSDNPIWLSPETWNATEVIIYVDLPWDTPEGDYEGYIYAKATDEKRGETQTLAIPIIIHVVPQVVFDVIVEIPPEKKEVYQGDTVYAKVTIVKVYPEDVALDVNMTYRIEANETVYDERRETIAVIDRVERYPKLRVPSDAPEGIYIFSATLEYQNNVSVVVYAYDTFIVRKRPPPPAPAIPPPTLPPPPPPFYLFLNLSTHRIVTLAGNTTGFLAWVKNLYAREEMGIRLLTSGIPAEWVSITPYRANILPGETHEYMVLIKIPPDVEEGKRILKIKARNAHESNEEMVVIFIGKSWKSIAEILLEELERLRKIANETFKLTCLDIKPNFPLFEEGETARRLGLGEFNIENYKRTVDFFMHAIEVYEKVISRSNSLMELEFKTLKPFVFPPFVGKIQKSANLMEKYLKEKNYAEFCRVVKEINAYSLYSTATLIFVISGLVTTAILLIYAYKRRKELELALRLRKIKERLQKLGKKEE